LKTKEKKRPLIINQYHVAIKGKKKESCTLNKLETKGCEENREQEGSARLDEEER